jgi:predicted GNAT superfamily acetyltransferase
VDAVRLTPAIEIRGLGELPELLDLERVFSDIWRREEAPPLSAELMRALAHSGNYVAGAYHGDRLVAGLVGFLGLVPSHELHLHSHILGVLPDVQLRGTGFALKQHQRTWSLERGIGEITWTFDPLVRRNGYFNVCKLGADILEYHVDFYGRMGDGINGDGASDRVLAQWRLRSPRAEAAAAGRPQEPELDALLREGAEIALETGEDGAPVAHAVSGPLLLCHTPADIVALRQERPDLTDAWRADLRASFGAALRNGYAADGMTRSGWYVLRRPR